MERHDGRTANQLRPIQFVPGVAPNAAGSVLVSFGDTSVICAVTIEEGVPRWMKEQRVDGGWLTAEYSMLPYSTSSRKQRDSTKGKVDGRSTEIQRLIGRSLRAVVDLELLGPRTLWIDCDVLRADGGTRTASITGACVAVAIACEKLLGRKLIHKSPLKKKVAAVSAGVVNGQPCLDLDYVEDVAASVDFNLVMTEDLDFVEVQGSGEEATFSASEMEAMLALGREGVRAISALQDQAIAAARLPAAPTQLVGLADFFAKKAPK